MAFKTSKFYETYLKQQSEYNIVNPKDQSYIVTPQQFYAAAGGYFRTRERTEQTEKEFIDYAVRKTTYQGFVDRYQSNVRTDTLGNQFVIYKGRSYDFIDKDVYRDIKEILNIPDKQILEQLQTMSDKEIESISGIRSRMGNLHFNATAEGVEHLDQLIEMLNQLEKKGVKLLSYQEKQKLYKQLALVFPNYKNIVSYLLSPTENSLEVI